MKLTTGIIILITEGQNVQGIKVYYPITALLFL